MKRAERKQEGKVPELSLVAHMLGTAQLSQILWDYVRAIVQFIPMI